MRLPRLSLPVRVVLFPLIVFLLIKMMWYALYVGLGIKHVDDQQRMLLYHTDHRAVFAACKDLMRRRMGAEWDSMNGDDSRLPLVIRRLHPSDVSINEYRVDIGIGGGFFHFGFQALADNPRSKDFINQDWAHKELLPGFWYYAETDHIIDP